MAEREQGSGRQSTAERDETVTHPAGFDPAAGLDGARQKPGRLAPRPDKGLPFAEALDETMHDHRAVFAALAK